jgi:2-haloalkanoic acid dehalogenase type II
MERNAPPALTDFRVLTFDCYGTLIDWETGIWDAFQPVIADNGGQSPGRQQLLEAFGTEECRQEAETPDMPYPEILCRVHRAVAARFGLESTARLDLDFGHSIPSWPAFPDSADALRFLKNHFRLVILSNVNRAGFAASNRKLGVAFDAIYTAEDIGSYKPSIENFNYLLQHLESDFGLGGEAVLHTAQSLFHDLAPAVSLGLATAWIDRQRLSEGGDWGATAALENRPDTDFRFYSMAELAAAVGAEADSGG